MSVFVLPLKRLFENVSAEVTRDFYLKELGLCKLLYVYKYKFIYIAIIHFMKL